MATWYKFGKPDPSFCCNGMLGGLVAVTAPCAFVDPWAAVVIGAVAGVIVVVSCLVVEEALKLDDPVGAISVHGACGAFGCLALGIFANGKYLGVAGLVAGNGGQFVTQLIGVATCFLFFFPTALIMFAVSNRIAGGGRASDAEQIEGLDLAEMGVEAYPDSR
jgi:Amt family ammonium transporter